MVRQYRGIERLNARHRNIYNLDCPPDGLLARRLIGITSTNIPATRTSGVLPAVKGSGASFSPISPMGWDSRLPDGSTHRRQQTRILSRREYAVRQRFLYRRMGTVKIDAMMSSY